AYDAFLKGEEASRVMSAGDPPSLRKALGYYEQAVAPDPRLAHAWARGSMADSVLYFNSAPPPPFAERAPQGARKGMALAPNRPEGYMALGNYELNIPGDPGPALEQYAKARRLAPTNAEALTLTARAEQAAGRWEAVVDHFQQAERLDPRSVITLRRLG